MHRLFLILWGVLVVTGDALVLPRRSHRTMLSRRGEDSSSPQKKKASEPSSATKTVPSFPARLPWRLGRPGNGSKSASGMLAMLSLPPVMPVQEAIATLMDFFMTNIWYMNLMKHVLTLISIRFILSAFMDYRKNEPDLPIEKLPRYIAALGLFSAGLWWLDSIILFPYYIVNIAKNALALVVVSTVLKLSIARSDRRAGNEEKKKEHQEKVVEKIEMAKVAELVSPPTSTAIQVPPVAKESITKTEKEDEEKDSQGIVEKVEEAQLAEAEVAENENEKKAADEEETGREERSEKMKASEDFFISLLHSLANIQEDMAELQLKRIPALFSRDTYDRAEDGLNKMNRKVLDFFKDD